VLLREMRSATADYHDRMAVVRRDLRLTDGRTLCAYDAGGEGEVALVWHHGSPQSGAPLPPLLEAAAPRGFRLVSYGRPSYGGSTPRPGRDVASAAGDVAQLADALGLERFAVMGASGGGPHALACAALLSDRITGVVCLASPAPFTGAFDWFDGMIDPGGLRAALEGREARVRHAETAEFDERSFTPEDYAALSGAWASLGEDAGHAGTAWPDGLIDDDLAFVNPWGFELEQVGAPVLVVQGGKDRVIPAAHADLLVRGCRRAELWLRPLDGHVSVLSAVPVAMDWLRASTSDP
jgi:pimeloyl-ACP methyl ester carboxylesterase